MLFCTKRAFVPWETEDEYQPTKKFLTEELAEKIYNLYLTDNVKKPTEIETPTERSITPPSPNYSRIVNSPSIVPRTLMPAE